MNGMSSFILWISLYGDARASLLQKRKIHDFVSKFADRVEDSTLLFYQK